MKTPKKTLIIFTLLLGCSFFININQAKAEGICHVNHCFIPAPTIVVPEEGFITYHKKPVIRGLTWKRTLVDIYLDGQYQGPVLLKEHENHLQSFFWQPNSNLSAGEHYVYTIAYNSRGYDKSLKGWDQSKESTYIYFTITEAKSSKLLSEINLPTTNNENEIITSEQNTVEKENKIISSEENIIPIKNFIEEEEQKRKQRNLRIFGFIILIVFMIILIINHFLKKKKEYINNIIKEIKDNNINQSNVSFPIEGEANQFSRQDKVSNDNEIPPPPPKNQDSLGI